MLTPQDNQDKCKHIKKIEENIAISAGYYEWKLPDKCNIGRNSIGCLTVHLANMRIPLRLHYVQMTLVILKEDFDAKGLKQERSGTKC